MPNTRTIAQQTKHLHVLYVEDEDIMRESSNEMFENFFSSVTTASNGEEALILYKKSSFDLIITDIYMPKMDGIEFIKQLRDKDKKLPIIVFSALNDFSYMSTCISLNVDAYILKPMQMSNLLDALQKISYKLAYEPQGTQKINPSKTFEKTFNIDKLTNLKSHNALLDDIMNVPQYDTPVLILINIDEFHTYNELYGLDIGDIILMKFAKILQKFAKEYSYNLYRMSGDEFVLFEVVKGIDPQKYENDMESLFHCIDTEPIKITKIKELIFLSISVGLSFDVDNGYAKADMALHESRLRGRRYLGFSEELDKREELKQKLYWKQEIYNALAQKRVQIYYSPIVDKDKTVLKYEAILKLQQTQQDTTMKLISPKQILDFSKISKLYIDLTSLMINQAFDTMLKNNVHIAINLSFHDIQNRELNKLLHQRISKHNIATKIDFDISSQVIFELIEHSNREDYDKFIRFIDKFKALGVLITIDNFGMGFANMSKIAAMSPNYVKIDATLMKNIDTDKHAYSLVKAIVKFTKELGIKTIAEHVSSESILNASIELGIDEFQGTCFGQPLASLEETH